MLTFSMNLGHDDIHAKRVWGVIEKNEKLFKFYWHADYQEAMQKTFITAMDNRKDLYTDIEPYIKKLANIILRGKSREIAYNTYTDDGEVAKAFTVLKEYNDDTMIVLQEISDELKELYLRDEEEFKKLRALLYAEETCESSQVISDNILKGGIKKLISNYGSTKVFHALYEFFKFLAATSDDLLDNKTIREITLKEGNFCLLGRIPDFPVIITDAGKMLYIHKDTMTMDENPDYVNWRTIKATNTNIVEIDISGLMNYMYEEVMVDQGVNTRHIRWCDNKYRLVTPGGTVVVGMDRDKFLTHVRVEFVLNVIGSSLNTIVALSEEKIYIKPTRQINFSTLRVILNCGKIIDLPVSVRVRNRNNYCGS